MARRAEQRRGGIPLAGDSLSRTRYGLSAKAVSAMLHAQHGGCAICGTQIDGPRVVVDHDHRLASRHPHGASAACRDCVRALLCNSCNLMLGNAKDSSETLRLGADYVAMWRKLRG